MFVCNDTKQIRDHTNRKVDFPQTSTEHEHTFGMALASDPTTRTAVFHVEVFQTVVP